MRVLLVGQAFERARVRAHLDSASIDVVAEFTTLGAAQAADIPVDAIVMSASRADNPLTYTDGEDATPNEALTPREIEVVELLAEGLSNKAIAGRLGISDQTVKFHVSSIYGKLGAANRTDAVRRAVRRGLLTL